MKVTATEILPTRSGLLVALSIRGPKDAWLRFATVQVPWHMITPELVAQVQREWDRERLEDEMAAQLPLDWS